MGGIKKQKKHFTSSVSVFSSLFKFLKPRRRDDQYYIDDAVNTITVWHSDEDRGKWVADPAINRKADDFIAKIHRNIVSDFSETQTMTVDSTGN